MTTDTITVEIAAEAVKILRGGMSPEAIAKHIEAQRQYAGWRGSKERLAALRLAYDILTVPDAAPEVSR